MRLSFLLAEYGKREIMHEIRFPPLETWPSTLMQLKSIYDMDNFWLSNISYASGLDYFMSSIRLEFETDDYEISSEPLSASPYI